MPKYLLVASYTADGAKGVLKDGGSKRRQVAEDVIRGIGGKLEAFYFAMGSDDVFAIYEAPDNATTAAASLVVGASGAIRAKTIVLLTPEEIDAAAEKGRSIAYRPPGT